jgi:hypothetical protein
VVYSHFLSESGEKLATQVMVRNVKTNLTVQNNRIKDYYRLLFMYEDKEALH